MLLHAHGHDTLRLSLWDSPSASLTANGANDNRPSSELQQARESSPTPDSPFGPDMGPFDYAQGMLSHSSSSLPHELLSIGALHKGFKRTGRTLRIQVARSRNIIQS